MKKFRMHIIGALLLSSFPMHAATVIKKRRSYNCQSDKKITQSLKKYRESNPEYNAMVTDIDGVHVQLVARRNFLQNKEIRSEILANERAYIENTGRYLTIQGTVWALAIAPEKKRASLYSSNPDINEIPMFCLSQGIN